MTSRVVETELETNMGDDMESDFRQLGIGMPNYCRDQNVWNRALGYVTMMLQGLLENTTGNYLGFHMSWFWGRGSLPWSFIGTASIFKFPC